VGKAADTSKTTLLKEETSIILEERAGESQKRRKKEGEKKKKLPNLERASLCNPSEGAVSNLTRPREVWFAYNNTSVKKIDKGRLGLREEGDVRKGNWTTKREKRDPGRHFGKGITVTENGQIQRHFVLFPEISFTLDGDRKAAYKTKKEKGK